MTTDGEPRPRRTGHYTPLRYPGGKGKLAAFVKSIIETNHLLDGEYVEPYAGGAAIALELLFQQYVSRIHINDKSWSVYCFWKSATENPDELAKLTRDATLDVAEWDRQRHIFKNQLDFSPLEVGFATFFLNRTNRSGILNAGIIGGRNQTGAWKIDARYNRQELAQRIEDIGAVASRINVSNLDAVEFIESGAVCWPDRTLIYLDPPYYEKGRHLYYDYYLPGDHAEVAQCVSKLQAQFQWLVSYDDVPQIHDLYSTWQSIRYRIGYSARNVHQGSEAMFFSERLAIPALSGPLTLIEEDQVAA